METKWPGEPHEMWDEVDDDGADLWVPNPNDLPSYATPQDLSDNYLVVAVWWQRALLVFFVLGFAVLVGLIGGIGLDWSSYGLFKRILAVIVATMLGGGALWIVTTYVVSEIRWYRAKADVLRRGSQRLRDDPVPVWGLFVDKIRLGDRQSGPNDTPDDIVFLFDLRVPSRTLRRQRAVVTAWVEKVAAEQHTNVPPELGAAFRDRWSIHCAGVFGEQLRGVWMWRKGSILPYQVLGMALTDPQTADEFTDDDVVFLRRTPKDLRRRSRLSHP